MGASVAFGTKVAKRLGDAVGAAATGATVRVTMGVVVRDSG